MTVGNVLGLLQYNVKRVLAYSSVAHTGYMLAALAALSAARSTSARSAWRHRRRPAAVLFYLTAYGITNIGMFGVARSSLPAAKRRPGGDHAETFEDLAGQGRRPRRRSGFGWRSAASA